MRASCLILLVLFLCASSLSARPFITLFGSELCDECQEFKKLYLAEMTAPEAPALVYVCIDDDEAYLFLNAVEKALHAKNTSAKFPVLLAGEHLIYGLEEIKAHFDDILAWSNDAPGIQEMVPIRKLANASTVNFIVWKPEANKEPDASSTNGQTTSTLQCKLLFLETSANCRHCERQDKELAILQKSLPDLIITRCEISTTKGQVLYQRFLRHFKIAESNENLAPLLAWENGYVSGHLASSEELAQALKSQANDKIPFWTGDPTPEELAALDKKENDFLSQTTLATTVLAGLLDGINPCAFATVIFLISYLLYLKRGRRFVLSAGLCFCAGVFLSYLLLGIGLSFLVDFLNRFAIVKTIVYGLFALAGFILFVMHLRDAVRYHRTGVVSQMKMGLDAQSHRKIHDKIHRWAKLSSTLALPAAVMLGCVVSSMEFVCTGQIYLPMLMAINARGFNPMAFLSLLLYNLAFVLPLLAVSFLAYYGVGAQALTKWAQDHVFATKVLMAILFLLLAILMLSMFAMG